MKGMNWNVCYIKPIYSNSYEFFQHCFSMSCYCDILITEITMEPNWMLHLYTTLSLGSLVWIYIPGQVNSWDWSGNIWLQCVGIKLMVVYTSIRFNVIIWPFEFYRGLIEFFLLNFFSNYLLFIFLLTLSNSNKKNKCFIP